MCAHFMSRAPVYLNRINPVCSVRSSGLGALQIYLSDKNRHEWANKPVSIYRRFHAQCSFPSVAERTDKKTRLPPNATTRLICKGWNPREEGERTGTNGKSLTKCVLISRTQQWQYYNVLIIIRFISFHCKFPTIVCSPSTSKIFLPG
jgi:hypothetical protein